MQNVLVALRLFGEVWQHNHVKFHVDNIAVVHALNNGRMQDTFLQAVAHSVWLAAAARDISLEYIHIAGSQNVKADALSRAFDSTCDMHKLNSMKNCVWWSVNGNACFINMQI